MSAIRNHVLSLPFLMLGAGAAFGHGQHEIKLEHWNGKLVPGHVAGNEYEHGVHVWSTAFGADFGLEDGYHALPVGTRLRFDLLDAARAWDGEDFDAPADGRITVRSAAGSVTSGDGPVRGFTATVQPGGIHWHLDFAFSGEVADGPHLLALAVDATLPSGEQIRSEPIWLVFAGGLAADAHDTALRHAEDALAARMHFDSVELEPGAPGAVAIHGATPGARVYLLASRRLASGERGALGIELARPVVVGVADAIGDEALFTLDLPPELAGQVLHVQAVELATGRASTWVSLRL